MWWIILVYPILGSIQMVSLNVLTGEADQECVMIKTHKGLFRYKRMSEGLLDASATRQCFVRKLEDIEGIECVMNDILVTGSHDEKHLQRPDAVLRCDCE